MSESTSSSDSDNGSEEGPAPGTGSGTMGGDGGGVGTLELKDGYLGDKELSYYAKAGKPSDRALVLGKNTEKDEGEDGDSDGEGKEAAKALTWRDSYVRGKASTFQGRALGEEKNGESVFYFPVTFRGQHQLKHPLLPLLSSTHKSIFTSKRVSSGRTSKVAS
jgi:hypothetical protein